MRLALLRLLAAVAAPLSLAAQSPAHQHEQAPTPGKTATVTGCLTRGVDPGTFVLKNVTWQSPATSSPGHDHGHRAVPPATDPPATTETLRLAGAASTLRLEAFVGHTVRATGALARTDPPATPGAVLPDPQPQGDTTSRTRGAEEQPASPLRTFEMRSMTDVAAECRLDTVGGLRPATRDSGLAIQHEGLNASDVERRHRLRPRQHSGGAV
jgi:hypothetical protein